MRDYLAATRDRVVVFDGSMGATLEQFDLSLEKDYKLPGRAHEALVLNRPDVIEDLHRSMVEVGAEVVETDTFQASRLKLDEWGLGDHTYEINRKAAEIARKAIGEDRFVAGSIGPTGHLPASDDPTLGKIRFRELVGIFAEHHSESVQHTVGVSKDLREGIRLSVEIIANEVVRRRRAAGLPIEGEPGLASDLTRQSLRFLYRILFVLYAETSNELGVLPVTDPQYRAGYGIDRLRDLTLTKLTTDRSRPFVRYNDLLEDWRGRVGAS